MRDADKYADAIRIAQEAVRLVDDSLRPTAFAIVLQDLLDKSAEPAPRPTDAGSAGEGEASSGPPTESQSP